MYGNYYRQGGYPYNYPGVGYGMNQGKPPQSPYGGKNEPYNQYGQSPIQGQGDVPGGPPQGPKKQQQQPQTQARPLPPSQMPSSHCEPNSSGAPDKGSFQPGMRGGAGDADNEQGSSAGEEKKKPRAGVYRKRGVNGMEYGVIGSDGSSTRVENGLGRFFW